ncbi:hypothetical protein AYI68_g1006 [Smittium mucronatum]|uniref:RING-type domain-containing protein n=1 Tax=Smittium mucronatum TaxID=133383 RepID=A0A1R0H6K1_9FUNG|nr:hypothetical protein AYI68_g1006 [Smittium mucronatum]
MVVLKVAVTLLVAGLLGSGVHCQQSDDQCIQLNDGRMCIFADQKYDCRPCAQSPPNFNALSIIICGILLFLISEVEGRHLPIATPHSAYSTPVLTQAELSTYKLVALNECTGLLKQKESSENPAAIAEPQLLKSEKKRILTTSPHLQRKFSCEKNGIHEKRPGSCQTNKEETGITVLELTINEDDRKDQETFIGDLEKNDKTVLHQFGDIGTDNAQLDCLICLDPILESQLIREIPCNHYFHSELYPDSASSTSTDIPSNNPTHATARSKMYSPQQKKKKSPLWKIGTIQFRTDGLPAPPKVLPQH